MEFKMSSAVAVKAKDPKAARRFYLEVLGFPAKQVGDERAIDADPLTMFIDERDVCDGILMELIVEDVAAARDYLKDFGCKVLKWEGTGKRCIVEDPYGVRYNLWQEPASTDA